MKDARIFELLSNTIINKIYLYMKLTWPLSKASNKITGSTLINNQTRKD